MTFFRCRYFAVLMFMLFSGAAYAEGGCPDGFVPNGAGTPGVPCIPGPASGGGSYESPEPQVKWESRFGAIAYDPQTGSVGVSSDQKNKRRASKSALAHCKSKGGVACAIDIDYSNQCAAIVYGGLGEIVKSATASAPSADEAESIALRNCKQVAGVECKVFYSGCSFPVQVQ